jgi:hypothetical protein
MKRCHTIWTISLVALLVLIIAVSLPACRRAAEKPAEPEVTELKTAQADECASFTGTWDTNRGKLTVVQEGCEAVGTLKGIGGGYYEFTGDVTSDTWDFEWKGPAGRGRGYFTIDPAGGTFTGEHGDGEDNTGTGKWDGTMVK